MYWKDRTAQRSKYVITFLPLDRKQFGLSHDGASGLPVSVNVMGVKKSGGCSDMSTRELGKRYMVSI